jgi:hypothetical protein
LLDLWAAAQESLQAWPAARTRASPTPKRTLDDDPDSDSGVPLQKRQRLAASSDEGDFKYVMLADNEGPELPDSILSLEKDHDDLGVGTQTGAVRPIDNALRYLDKIKVLLFVHRFALGLAGPSS